MELAGGLVVGLADSIGLRYVSELRTLLFMAVYFNFTAYQWLLYDETSSWISQYPVLVFVLTGFFAFQGSVTVHNTVHVPPFRSEWLNQIFFMVLSLNFGHTPAVYVPGHNLSHHRNLQTRKDIFRTTRMKFKWNFLNWLLYMPSCLGSIQDNDTNYFNAQKRKDRPIYHQLRREVFYFVAVQLILVLIDARKWFWVFWLPHMMGKYLIMSIGMVQHDGCDTDSEYNHSRNITGSLFNYLLFNNGYHTIHHMYPGKHWSLLKLEHQKRVIPFMHPNLDQDNVLEFVFKSAIYPGKRLNFDGTPTLICEDGPDEPWFYETHEAHSNGSIDERVWDKNIKMRDGTIVPKASLETKAIPNGVSPPLPEETKDES